MKEPSVNVLGQPLQTCGTAPLTGFFRNGCCDTGPADRGLHTVCAVMTEARKRLSGAAPKPAVATHDILAVMTYAEAALAVSSHQVVHPFERGDTVECGVWS